MNKAKLRLLLCLILTFYSITAFNVSAADITVASDATYSASQTMDIGIITGVIALAISALIILHPEKESQELIY